MCVLFVAVLMRFPLLCWRTLRYDAVLAQYSGDMAVYVRMVCDTLVATVPKAIVHGLVSGG